MNIEDVLLSIYEKYWDWRNGVWRFRQAFRWWYWLLESPYFKPRQDLMWKKLNPDLKD